MHKKHEHKEMSCKASKEPKGMKHKKKHHSPKHSKEELHEAHIHMEKHKR